MIVSVQLMCNNERTGLPTGRVEAIQIENWLHLNCDLSLDIEFDPELPKCGTVRIGRRKFEFTGYVYGYGNWCWDGVGVEPPALVQLLNYLQKSNKVEVNGCHDNVTEWVERFESRTPFRLTPKFENWLTINRRES